MFSKLVNIIYDKNNLLVNKIDKLSKFQSSNIQKLHNYVINLDNDIKKINKLYEKICICNKLNDINKNKNELYPLINFMTEMDKKEILIFEINNISKNIFSFLEDDVINIIYKYWYVQTKDICLYYFSNIKRERLINKFKIGSVFDVSDERGHFYESEIKNIDYKKNKVLFHYYFWDETYDEWIDFDSNRIQDHCSKIWLPGKKFIINQRIDVYDSHPQQERFLSAKVLEVIDDEHIRIHYANHGSQWDEIIKTNYSSNSFCRIAPWGHKSKKAEKYNDDYEKIEILHYFNKDKLKIV
tara:strand:- start:304 stop:1197 length:894 start_codon:yes stop_codon:yes gene_type:complete